MLPSRSFITTVVGAFGWLLVATFFFVACGRTRSLDCRRASNRCILRDYHWGLVTKQAEFSPARYVDVIIQSESVGKSRGNSRPSSRYFVLIGAYHGLSYRAQDEFSTRTDSALQKQYTDATEFVAQRRASYTDGRRFSLLHLLVLLPNFWLVIVALRRFRRAFVECLSARRAIPDEDASPARSPTKTRPPFVERPSG